MADQVGEREKHGTRKTSALAGAGGDDRIAGGVFAGIQNGITPLRRNIRLGAGGLDLLEFPCRVRFAAAGIDRLDQNFVFVHKPLHSFLVSVFSIPQAVKSMQE